MCRKFTHMEILVILVLALLAVSNSQNVTDKHSGGRRSYVCPPNFIRLSHKCYYFSKDVATWQEAYWQCRDRHSNLAIIRNANQDKLIRRMLNKQSVVSRSLNTDKRIEGLIDPLERWLGGMYDWKQQTWKWEASGKNVTFQGFAYQETDPERFRWHCIIVDPQLQYKWNARLCLEKKHYICNTKIKKVNNKKKKKLQKQYHVDKDNKLNEVAVPDLPPGYNNYTILKESDESLESNDIMAQFARRPGSKRKRKAKHRRRPNLHGDVAANLERSRRRQKKLLEDRRNRYLYNRENNRRGVVNPKIKWRTYYKDKTMHPMYPKPIVEEFDFMKEK